MKITHIIGYKKDLGRGYSLLGRASIDFIVIDVITHLENYDEDYVTMTKRSAVRNGMSTAASCVSSRRGQEACLGSFGNEVISTGGISGIAIDERWKQGYLRRAKSPSGMRL